MPRLPYIEQRTVAQGSRADAGMFGATSGQAMAQAGSALQDIGVAMKRREDVIDRTVGLGDMNKFARESLSALETQDLVRKQTIDTYVQGLRAKKDELLANHAGTAQSKAEFQAQLENQIAQYEQGANAARSKASHTMLGNMIDQRTNELAVDAGFAPDMLSEIFTQLDVDIDQFADALPAGMVEQYKNSGRTAIATTAVQRLQADEQFEAADQLLKDPDVRKFLPPDVSRRFIINNAAGKAKQDQEARQRESNVQSWAMALGIDPDQMTAQQRMIAENASPATMNLVQKMNLATMFNDGQPLSPETRNRILNIERQGNQTRLQDIMSQLPSFEGGVMSPQEQDLFRTEVFRMFPRQFRLNPDNDRHEPIPGTGGFDDLSAALGRPVSMPGTRVPDPRGRVPGGVPYGAQSGMAMPEDQDLSFTDPQGRTDFAALPPQPGEPGYDQSGMGAQPAAESQMPQPIPEAEMPQPTPVDLSAWGDSVSEVSPSEAEVRTIRQYGGLYMMADMLRGPKGAVGRLGANFPGIPLARQDFQRAKTEAELMQRKMVNALRTNPRYAEGERKDLAQSIDITASGFGNPDSYRTDLETIDAYMADEIQYWQNILNSPQTTGSDRRSALQFIPLMQQYRERINVPARPQNRQEWDQLEPGALYMNLRGEIRRK